MLRVSVLADVVVTIGPNGMKYRVRQRFSAFIALHRSCYWAVGLPNQFPVSQRVLVTDSTRTARVRQLGAYLRWLMAAVGDQPPAPVLTFLGVDPTPPSLPTYRSGGAAAPENAGESSVGDPAAAASSDPSAAALSDETGAAPPPAADQDLELVQDVYATAFVLASNATQDMYSIWPWRNRQTRVLWLYLVFIVGSQAFALATLLFLYPPVVDTHERFVDCERPGVNAALLEVVATRAGAAALESSMCGPDALADGVCGSPSDAGAGSSPLSAAAYSHCATLDVAFAVPLSCDNATHVARYRRVVLETYFYENVLGAASGAEERSLVLLALQLVCSIWVTVQVYFVDFLAVDRLLQFRDFNAWLLPLKGERPRSNAWVLLFPLTQYALGVAIVTVSCAITCSSTSGFDAIMNSLGVFAASALTCAHLCLRVCIHMRMSASRTPTPTPTPTLSGA